MRIAEKSPMLRLAFCLMVALSFSIIACADDALQQGIKLFEEGKFTEAQTLIEPYAKSNPTDAEAVFYLGRIYMHLEKIDQGIEWMEKAIEINPNNSNYHMWLGNAYGTKTQNVGILKQASLAGKIKKEFEKAVELDPNNLPARTMLMLYYLQAPGIMGGSDKKAQLQATEIKKRDLALGCQAFAQIYTKDKKYDLAEQEYLSAISQFPDTLSLRFGLGFLYQESASYDKAFVVYDSILAIKSEDPNALYQYARTASLSGKNLERAEAYLLSFIKMDLKSEDVPPLWGAHYRLGTIYEHAGKKDQARAEYETALKLNPDYDQAKAALKKLK